ncbi:MAG TPA: type II toxin-antitoxin system prevent-host-death family antitoxin [Acidobacteriota bacterium]|nr:type II toxin-antitoxin system prevent-host-death family antitoxin [Acidobacteriota bacterium]
MDVYSTYEAKAKFSEIMRKVRAGQHVFVTFHGRKVAEIRPIAQEEQSLEDRVRQLRQEGVMVPSSYPRPHGMPKPIAVPSGALRRFLEERD